ncbi:hypothetical protein I4U23_028471 [Adineta vaga]|nr:hypothetical protein I4U23_028471 [Adineta vaga]
MDDYAFRLANRLVGNSENAAGLECTFIGPVLQFHQSTTIAITGATMNATLDDISLELWKPIYVESGQILRLGRATIGCRTYIAIHGGFNVPVYLGSRATFVLGKFGGYAGRILTLGDILFIDTCIVDKVPSVVSNDIIPHYPTDGQEWQVSVLYGPHGAPDFFTSDYIQTFFATSWQVHYNSNRLGIRLLGLKPTWSRTNGGDAGLHPSNLHDCEYAIGSINFTGDTPVILTQDGPSLGGCVCPLTIVKGELWKIGQVKPNDRIHFHPITFDQALTIEQNQDSLISTLIPSPSISSISPINQTFECILGALSATNTRPRVLYRQAGDHYILIEYGSMNLDIHNRFRVHFLMEELEKHHLIEGILELSPGVRSLQIKYDSRIIHQQKLMKELLATEDRLPSDYHGLRVKSRIVYLPLTFEDSATLDAVKRYQETVKESAPWLPNDVDFIQRTNELSSRDDVRKIVFYASYLVLGLGDVYPGAPCAIPIDPRHRLVTLKYNPARTFTAEDTVGIGGVYMRIYGMDSAGAFRDGHLQIRIIEDNEFDLSEYDEFLKRESESITDFIKKRGAAFDEEVSHWQKDIEEKDDYLDSNHDIHEIEEEIDEKVTLIRADVCGSVWKLLVKQNDVVEANTPVVILEAMKMELVLRSPIVGRITSILCHVGQLVSTNEVLLKIESV